MDFGSLLELVRFHDSIYSLPFNIREEMAVTRPTSRGKTLQQRQRDFQGQSMGQQANFQATLRPKFFFRAEGGLGDGAPPR